MLAALGLQDARPGPDASDRAQRGRADLDEPRRSRDGFDDRRRPREEDRGRVKEDAMLSAPEAIPEPMVCSNCFHDASRLA